MGTNYYVLKNYPHCNNGDRIHIGKRSCGWAFIINLPQDLPIKSPKDWLNFIIKNHYPVCDDSGNILSKKEIENLLRGKRTPTGKLKRIKNPIAKGKWWDAIDGEWC